MDQTTPTPAHRFPWITTVIIIIVLLAGIQWWSTRGSTTTTKSDQYVTSTTVVSIGDQSSSDQQKPTTTTTTSKTNFMHTITIETSKGTIVLETYDADAPKASENFVTLAGKGFYDGTIFHRVIPGFMIQGGDPTGTGRGGPGYQFADELDPSTESYKTGYARGTVAMANSGPNTNGSQFFIMHKDYPLQHDYTIFGRVVKGMEVVDAIATSQRDASDRPLEQIVMKKVTVANK